jgi:hypothetical protein
MSDYPWRAKAAISMSAQSMADAGVLLIVRVRIYKPLDARVSSVTDLHDHAWTRHWGGGGDYSYEEAWTTRLKVGGQNTITVTLGKTADAEIQVDRVHPDADKL